MIYRYVGSDVSRLEDLEYEQVGDPLECSEQRFYEVVMGGAAFIPEEDFERVGFTEGELIEHGCAGTRYEPPISFVQKLESAQQVFRALRQKLRAESFRAAA